MKHDKEMVEMQAIVHGKNNFEWTERLCGDCSDKQYRRSCELCGQILATWDYRKHLTDNHSKEDVAKLQKKYGLDFILSPL